MERVEIKWIESSKGGYILNLIELKNLVEKIDPSRHGWKMQQLLLYIPISMNFHLKYSFKDSILDNQPFFIVQEKNSKQQTKWFTANLMIRKILQMKNIETVHQIRVSVDWRNEIEKLIHEHMSTFSLTLN